MKLKWSKTGNGSFWWLEPTSEIEYDDWIWGYLWPWINDPRHTNKPPPIPEGEPDGR